MTMAERYLPRNVVKCDTIRQAMEAYEAKTASGARAIPGVVFWQGRRLFFSSAIGFQAARHFLQAKPIDKKALKSSDVDPFESVRNAFNRALDPAHRNAIADYLVHHSDLFILPPLIVNNVDDTVMLVCAGNPAESAQVLGWLIVDDQFNPIITDGQHRQAGILEALIRKHGPLKFSSVGLMVSFEQEHDQMHQDFADCAKTKQISPSLMQVYDRRASSSRIAQQLIERCKLFGEGKVDPEGKTIAKGSIKLFLHSQVVGFVKAMVSDRRSSTLDFEEVLAGKLESDPEFGDKLVAYVNDLTAAIEPYRVAAALAMKDRDKIPELRAGAWMPLAPSGLATLGLVGRTLLACSPQDYTAAINKLAHIDWKITGSLWRNNLCLRDGAGNVKKVQTGATAIEHAAKEICDYVMPRVSAAA